MDFTPKSDLKIFQIFSGILELYFQFIPHSPYIGGQFHHIRNIFPKTNFKSFLKNMRTYFAFLKICPIFVRQLQL